MIQPGRLVTPDAVEIQTWSFPARGGGARVWLAHATGFCALCWSPVASRLEREAASITGWDFRGHGRSQTVPRPVSWWDMATDVLTVVDGSGIGVGHSMGGAALVMAEVTRPGTFSALVLAEPILLAPPVRRGSYPLAEVVRKRRRVFGSRAAARENFVSKLPFSRWGSAALDGYVAGGLVDAANGVVLGCDPDFEADVYDRSTGHGVLELVSRVSAPVVVLVGEDSDTYDVEWAGVIASAFPQGRLEVVRAGTHFIPMEQPEVVAAAVRSVVDQDAE